MRNDRKNQNNKSKATISLESYSSNLESTINNAIRKDKVLLVEYFSREKGMTLRELEPMDIVIRSNKKNLVGWCRLRNDWRTFRIDRINMVAIKLDESFEPREDYRRENFEDENVKQTTQKTPINSELPYKSGFAKTITDNKLNFSKDDDIVTYSEEEDDLAM